MILSEKKIKIQSPWHISELIRGIINSVDYLDYQENFYSIGLNTKNTIQYIDLVSIGTLSEAHVHPRDVYRMAIIKNCFSIIVCHNHPSGSCEPSKEDIGVTKRLKESGKILGIPLIDHIIITDDFYYSFRESNMIEMIDTEDS